MVGAFPAGATHNVKPDALGVDDLVATLAEREKELRYQRAVAACARALLSRDASDHLGDALQALLDASDATSLFVARNGAGYRLG